MADITKKKVSELTTASELGSSDLLLVQQGGEARALLAGDLQDYCKKGVEQYETNAKASAEAAAASAANAETFKQAADDAKRAAETAKQGAEDAAKDVEASAQKVAESAAAQVKNDLAGYVSDAQIAEAGAETARDAAAGYANSSAGFATDAANIVKDAQSYVDAANTAKKQAMSYSNSALNSANKANDAAERAESAAKRATGENVNWEATKDVIGGGDVIIAATDVAFSGMAAAVKFSGDFNFVLGESYIVTWDNDEYTCVCYQGDGNYYIGNGDLIGETKSNDEPFCFFWYVGATNTTVNIYKETTTAETIGVKVITGDAVYRYSRLPVEHLTPGVPVINAASVGQYIVVTSVDSDGVPTAWKSVDSPALPTVTSGDNGKFLRVVGGAWSPVALTDVSEVGA